MYLAWRRTGFEDESNCLMAEVEEGKEAEGRGKVAGENVGGTGVRKIGGALFPEKKK